MQTREEIVEKIKYLEGSIKYYNLSMKEYSFERTQNEIENSEMYRGYKQKREECFKKIELLRSEILKIAYN